LGIATYSNTQESVIVYIKQNEFRKIITAAEDKKFFSLFTEHSLIFENKDNEKFYHLDLASGKELAIEKEEG